MLGSRRFRSEYKVNNLSLRRYWHLKLNDMVNNLILQGKLAQIVSAAFLPSPDAKVAATIKGKTAVTSQ